MQSGDTMGRCSIWIILFVFAIYLVAGEEYDFDERDNDGYYEHGSKNPRRARPNHIPYEDLKMVALP